MTYFGPHYGQQILRGTAAAANYAGVRAAESRNDFIHKLGIVRKELCRCPVWLRLSARKHLVPVEATEPIRDECDQMVRIDLTPRQIVDDQRHTVRDRDVPRRFSGPS